MLVLSRRNGERIKVGDSVTILVVKIGRGKVRLGVAAPRDVPVHRAEFAERLSDDVHLKTIMEPVA